jgi:uncharacterized membrane protein YbhN (UPF0104 family)
VAWILGVALAAVAVLSAVAKAGKLQILLRGLGQRPRFGHMVAITLVTDFAFLVSPAGAAGYGVNLVLLRRAGVAWSMAATVVGADQALDLLFFVVTVPIAAAFALRPLLHGLPHFAVGPGELAVPGAALLVGALLWAARRQLLSALRALVAAVPWLRARRIRLGTFRAEVGAQMAVLLRAPPAWRCALLLLTAVQWLLRYGALWFILLELGHRLSFGFVLVLQAVILHLAIWTGVPAGGGSADFGLAAAAAPWVARPAMATALLLWRCATLYGPLLLGVLGLAALPRASGPRGPRA